MPNRLEPAKVKEKILFGPDGRRLNKNEGKWKFTWHETKHTLILSVEISKFLDTSFIELDIHPKWIAITIKGKLLQLAMDVEVCPEKSISERSKTSGQLCITMIKAKMDSEGLDIVKIRSIERAEAQMAVKEESEKIKASKTAHLLRDRRYEKIFTPQECVDYKNIVKSGEKPAKKPIMVNNIEEKRVLANLVPEDFVDDPDVPPLC